MRKDWQPGQTYLAKTPGYREIEATTAHLTSVSRKVRQLALNKEN
jgi:hypothetical protein